MIKQLQEDTLKANARILLFFGMVLIVGGSVIAYLDQATFTATKMSPMSLGYVLMVLGGILCLISQAGTILAAYKTFRGK